MFASVWGFTHDPPQFTSLAAQQIPVAPLVAQFPLWHSWLFVHALPLAILLMQFPLPSHAMPDPQPVPTAAGVALHTGVPVVQLIVPGAHVLPQVMLGVQETQAPALLQTWFVPQDEPAGIIFWPVQVGVPPLQSKVPGLHDDPQAAPAMQVTQAPLPSHTWLAPQPTPGAAFVVLHMTVPLLQS